MKCKKIVFESFFLIAITILASAQAFCQPLLIKLTLEKPVDYQNAISLGAVAYQRFEGFFLVELEGGKLEELDQLGLKYQIIDENPWSEEYFLVSLVSRGMLEVNLDLYGKVLLKEERWALLKTSKEKAFELMKIRAYKVVPIFHKPIPLKYKPTFKLAKPALTYSTTIDSLVNKVSQDSLRSWVQRLQNFKTRYSYSDSIVRARDWLYNKFVSFGIDSLWLHHYNWDSDQYNVVATVVGTAQPDKVIVVGGHYDSVVYEEAGGNPFTWAPGADDNATGTAATLEMARIIAQHPLPVTVMFVPFAQEEQGLIGSFYFAEYLHNQGTNVELMINSDMIAHSVDSDPDVIILASPSAMDFVNVMMAMGRVYTDLRPVYGGQSSGSDHYSFYQWGYDALFAHEGDFFYAGWHTNYDLVDSLNFSYMKEVVKMCFATLIFASTPHPSPVENLQARDDGNGHTIYLSWSANPPGENVVYYKVNFGLTSGHYDSIRQVYATSEAIPCVIWSQIPLTI